MSTSLSNKQISRSHDFTKELSVIKSPLFHKLEESMRQHAVACAEKNMLENKLQLKSEEIEQLRAELRNLTRRESDLNSESAEGKISACESEIADLKQRIKKLESTTEEQDMGVKRSKYTISMVFNNFIQDIKDERNKLVRQLSENNAKLAKAEKQHEANLKEKEQAVADMRAKHKNEIKVKDLEHKVAIQDKDLKIKDLEHERQLASERMTQKSDHAHVDHDQSYLDDFETPSPRSDEYIRDSDDPDCWDD